MNELVKPLKWTEERGLNSDIAYNHVISVTPFGRFVISWKGWKDNPTYCIEETPWLEYGGVANTLDDAKYKANCMLCERVLACLNVE